MADGYDLELQDGLIAALRADAALWAMVGGRIYDEAPDRAARPAIGLGSFEPDPLRSDGARAAWVAFSIEVYSAPATSGRVEAARIASAVVAALDEQEAAVPLATRRLVQLYWRGQTLSRDDNGKSYTAVIAFEALIDG